MNRPFTPGFGWFVRQSGTTALYGFALLLALGSAFLGLAAARCGYGTIVALTDGTHKGLSAGVWAWRTMGFGVATTVSYFIALALTHVSNYRATRKAREALMRHLITLPIGFFEEHSSGELAHLIEENIEGAHGLMAHLLPDLCHSLVIFIGCFALMFATSVKLALFSLIPLVIAFAAFTWMTRYATKMRQYTAELANMNAAATEYVRAMSVVKTFNVLPKSFHTYINAVKNYGKFASDYAYDCQIPMTINNVASQLTPVVLALAGFRLVRPGGATAAQMVFFVMLSGMLMLALMRLLFASEWTMMGFLCLRNLGLILDTAPQEGGTALPQNGDLTFENVTFTYPGTNEPAVKNLSFTLPRGQKWALVGPSGGGKSTVARLAARFWDPDEGRITLAGTDLKELDHKALMRHTAFVFQQSSLFKTTVLDNILAARPGGTRDEAQAAVKAACLEDVIARLPQGLDTPLGAKGTYLSGGEAQRVALARAVAQRAPLVLLDEATAFADPENEMKIQSAFSALAKDATVLMIAHRLTSVTGADRILVLDGGRIVEQGTHDELMTEGGLYAHLYDEYNRSLQWRITSKEARA